MSEVLDVVAPAESVDSTPEVDSSSAVESQETAVDSGVDTASVDESTSQPEQGKAVSPAVKTYLKELKTSDPKAAQEIERAIYGWQQFRTAYPEGIKSVQRMAQIVEAIGGQEGVQAIEAERAEWNALDEKFTAGDPAFVEAIAESDPEAFKKILPHALNKFSQSSPEEYAHLMAGIVTATVEPIAVKLYNALAADEKTKPLAQELADWFNKLDSQAKTRPQPKIDPEREKLQKDREAFENQKAQNFHAEVTNAMRTFNTAKISGELNSQFTKNGQKLADFKVKNPESYRILSENCNTAIQTVIGKDQSFMKQYQTILMSGDKDRALRLAQSKISAVAPDAVKRTVRAFMAFSGQKAKPEAAAVTPNGNDGGGARWLPKQPERKDIDWSRTPNDMVLSGRAYLKGQKQMVRFP